MKHRDEKYAAVKLARQRRNGAVCVVSSRMSWRKYAAAADEGRTKKDLAALGKIQL